METIFNIILGILVTAVVIFFIIYAIFHIAAVIKIIAVILGIHKN
jgi:hypothetical protein